MMVTCTYVWLNIKNPCPSWDRFLGISLGAFRFGQCKIIRRFFYDDRDTARVTILHRFYNLQGERTHLEVLLSIKQSTLRQVRSVHC